MTMKSLRFTCFLITLLLVVLEVSPVSAQGSKSSAPSPSPAPPSSTASFESQMLAYGGLQHIAKALGRTVCNAGGVDNDNSVIIIYDQPSFAALQSYEAFVANVQVVSSAYQTLIPRNDLQSTLTKIFQDRADGLETMAQNEQNPDKKDLDLHKARQFTLTLAPIDPVADTAAVLTAIAVAANTETPGQITVPDSAMAISLTREIEADCKNKVTIIYPPLFGTSSTSDYASADIQVAIQKLDDIRTSAMTAVSEANKDYLANYPTPTTTTTATTKGTKPTDQTVTTLVSADQATLAPISADPVATAGLTDVNGLYDSFMNSLLQVNASTGLIGSSSVIQGYRLARLLKGTQCADSAKTAAGICPGADSPVDYSSWKNRPAFIVLASVVSSGGTEHDHKTLWTALTSGDKISYSGGVIVNASIWSAVSTSPIYLDVLRYRTPFSQLHSPADVTGVDSGDNLK
jgi:hypothetical protein